MFLSVFEDLYFRYSLGKFDKIYNAEDFINVYEDLIEQFRETFPEYKVQFF